MAFPTHVNDLITDAVTQANVKVVAEAPAMALSNLYQSLGQSMAMMAQSGMSAQQQTAVTAQAATTMGVSTLYAVDTASTAAVTELTTGDMVIGHIHSKLASPQGNAMLQQAVVQAQKSSLSNETMELVSRAQTELEGIFKTAIEQGISKQAMCYAIHDVALKNDISLLYPALDAPSLTVEDIIAYYNAIITAFHTS